MNILQVREAVLYALNSDTRLVTHVEGKPGIGKSDMAVSISKELAVKADMEWYSGAENFDATKMGMIDVRITNIEPSDFTGIPIPSVDKKEVQFTASPYIPTTGQGILFLDEIRQGSQQMLALCSQLLLDRRVGTNKLGDGWRIISASNSTKDRANAHRLPTHVANRLMHLELEFDLKSFTKYLHDNDYPDVASAFVKYRPAIVDSFDANSELNCTPRSICSAFSFLDAPESLRFDLIKGCIGEGASAELLGFNKVWKELPSVEQVLHSPTTTHLPTSPDIQFAVSTMLAYNTTEESMKPMLAYLNRMEEREYVTLYVKSVIEKQPNLATSDAFNEFLADNVDYLV